MLTSNTMVTLLHILLVTCWNVNFKQGGYITSYFIGYMLKC